MRHYLYVFAEIEQLYPKLGDFLVHFGSIIIRKRQGLHEVEQSVVAAPSILNIPKTLFWVLSLRSYPCKG